MTDGTARVILASAALPAALGLARTADTIGRSIRGDGTVEGLVSLVLLVAATAGFLLIRRYIRRRNPRPRLRSMWTLFHWALGASIPLLTISMVRATMLEPVQGVFVGEMKHDLLTLQGYQDSIMVAAGRYEANPVVVTHPGSRGPRVSLTPDGWTARIERDGAVAYCVMYEGSTALAPAQQPRVSRCTRVPFHVAGLLQGLGLMAAGLLIATVLVATRRPAVVVERRV